MKQIMGIGNVLRHNYDDVVESIIYDTTRQKLDSLLSTVLAEIEAGDLNR